MEAEIKKFIYSSPDQPYGPRDLLQFRIGCVIDHCPRMTPTESQMSSHGRSRLWKLHYKLLQGGYICCTLLCNVICNLCKINNSSKCTFSVDRLGGPDPLDYISMYANPGDENRGIPPHWHYISYGLSDLHGDGRVHE